MLCYRTRTFAARKDRWWSTNSLTYRRTTSSFLRDLLQARDGITYESFSPGRDQGIDLRYLSSDGTQHIVQCKHWAKSGYNALLSNLKTKEKPKVDLLSPSRYSLATTVPLTPHRKSEIVEAMSPHILSPSDVLGSADINNLLGLHKDVERKTFKLWLTGTTVLKEIFNNGIVVFTKAAIEDMQRKCSLYVHNDGYAGATSVLDSEHCCIIAGAPGIGKTMLAEMLLLHHMAEGYEPVVISESIAEADSLYGQDERQIFYYDDFLGQTSLSEKLVKNEDARLLKFIERVRLSESKRFIMTTREYILRQAQRVYEPLARANVSLPRYVLELQDYTRHNKAEILYNHVWHSSLSEESRNALVEGSGYLLLIDHHNYNPRLIEAIIQQASRNACTPEGFLAYSLKSLDDPATVWSHPFDNQLDVASKAILRALLIAGTHGESVELVFRQAIAISDTENHAISLSSCHQGLREMDESFISIDDEDDAERIVRYNNPSIRDFMLNRLEMNPSLIRSLLSAVTLRRQLTVLAGYASASQDDDLTDFEIKYPAVRAWLRANLMQLSDLIRSLFDLSTEANSKLPYPVGENELRMALTTLWRIDDSFKPDWLPDLMAQYERRWRDLDGDRLGAIRLVDAADRHRAVPTEQIKSLDEALRSWPVANYDVIEDYSYLLEMEDLRPGSITEEELELARVEAEATIVAEPRLFGRP